MDIDIKNVDLLIFDKDVKFMECVKVENDRLVIIGMGINFIVCLDVILEWCIIYLVVNGWSVDGILDCLNFGDIIFGMIENVVIFFLQIVLFEYVDEGESILLNYVMFLVMWGCFVLNGINIVMKVEGVKLLCFIVCI